MRPLFILLVVVIAFLFQGCIVKSMHPFYNENDVVFRPELLDSWVDADGGNWIIKPVKEKSNAYEMQCSKDGKNATFIVHLFGLDEKLYLDFVPLASEGSVPLFDLHLLPTHSVAKVEILSNREVQIKWFNERWLSTLFEQNRIKIAHEEIMDETPSDDKDKMYVLTASTTELQKFLLKYGSEDSAFDDDNTVRLTLKRTL